jgi:ankyrin repeat protein
MLKLKIDFENAIKQGSLPKVQECINQGMSSEEKFNNIPAIMFAAQCGHAHIVSYLDEQLKNKYLQSSFFSKAMYWISSQSYRKNLQLENGYTFLHAAVIGDNLTLVKKAIEEYHIPLNCHYEEVNESGVGYSEFSEKYFRCGCLIIPLALAVSKHKSEEVIEYLMSQHTSTNSSFSFEKQVIGLPRSINYLARIEKTIIRTVSLLSEAVQNEDYRMIAFL